MVSHLLYFAGKIHYTIARYNSSDSLKICEIVTVISTEDGDYADRVEYPRRVVRNVLPIAMSNGTMTFRNL